MLAIRPVHTTLLALSLFLSGVLFPLNGLSFATAQIPGAAAAPEKEKTEKQEENAADSAKSETEPKVPAHLETPLETLNYFVDNTRASMYRRASCCLDFGQDSSATESQKAEKAWKLSEIMMRLPPIIRSTVGDTPDAENFRYQPNYQYPPIEITRGDDQAWRFNRQTVLRIDSFYEKIKDQPPVEKNWVQKLFPASYNRKAFLLANWQWIVLGIGVVLGFIFDHLTRWILTFLTLGWMRVRGVTIDRREIRRSLKPFGLLACALFWVYVVNMLRLPPTTYMVLIAVVQFFCVSVGIWAAFGIIDIMTDVAQARLTTKDNGMIERLVIPLVSRVLKFAALAIGLIVFARTFDLPVAGLLGGLGISGFALAFASKESLGNFFGLVTVVSDQTFKPGDWIKTGEYEGIVEDIGFRCTRIRTFYDSIVSIPNGQMVTSPIDNLGRRRYRRYKTALQLEYDTPPERILAFCEGVRELIRSNSKIKRDNYVVYMNDFGEHSLDITLVCFFICPDANAELHERHRLIVDILRLADVMDVRFAFPTQKLYNIETVDKRYAVEDGELKQPKSFGKQTATQLVAHPIVADQPNRFDDFRDETEK